MFRKLILAAIAAIALGSAALVAANDASARGFGGGGFHGGGMRGGHGGGMRMGGGFGRHGGGFQRHGGFARHGGGHFRPHVRHHHRFGHFRHHHFRHHHHHCRWGFGHRCHVRWYPNYWRYTAYTAPVAVAAPVYTAPVSAGPVCNTCGGWTPDGGYMTYKKFINEITGQPELKCVKVFDEATAPIEAPLPQQGS